MKKPILLLATLLLAFNFSRAQIQTNIEKLPNIQAIGVGSISVFPNAAEITIALDHIKPTLREAINENQQTADKVLEIVKQYVSDEKGIKVSLITTDKATSWNARLQKDVFLGYESSQKILFTLNDLNKMQDFTEALLKTKFKQIESISYFHTNAAEYIKQAQELAVKDAMETTQRMAKSASVKTGKILSIAASESPNQEDDYRNEASSFRSYSKAMGGRGVKSSGEIIKYQVSVNLTTSLVD